MKITAILGSPHRNGNGAAALDAYLEGAKANQNEVTTYTLCTQNVKNCLGCRRCIENGGACVIKDDFTEIFESIKTADLVVIASPIYINQVNGITKTFLDRCYPLTDAHHRPRFGKRRLVFLCTYGAPIPFIFSRTVRRTAKSLKAMGLVRWKTILIPGCTTLDKVKNDETLRGKLFRMGKKI